MRRVRRAALVVAAALVAPATALAAPPTLLEVGHDQQRPTARWTLAPGAHADAIEFATDPALRPDGRFLASNLALVAGLESSQTSFRSESLPLQTGVTYYVHVASCAPCPAQEWSNVLTIRIPNVVPRLRAGESIAHRSIRRGYAQLEVCDDAGPYRVEIRQQRLRGGRIVASAVTTVAAELELTGCGAFNLEWRIPPRLIATGDLYRVTFRVVDVAGARSAPLSFASRWRR